MLYSLRQLQNKCSQHPVSMFHCSPFPHVLKTPPYDQLALWCSVASVCTIWQTLAPHIQARLLWIHGDCLVEIVVNNPRVQLDLFLISMILRTPVPQVVHSFLTRSPWSPGPMSRVSVTRCDVSPVTPSRPGPCVTLRGAVLLRSKCDHLNLVQDLSSDIIVTNK